MLDTIKSYLVSLGFAINDSEFNKATKALNDLDRSVTSVTSGMAKSFAVAGTEITGVITAVVGATGALIKETAELDMQYQKFALRMWMTKDSAKQLQVTLKAMGESVEDVAWIPELRQQYYQLLNQGNQMQTPGDAGEQLKYIRSILFEFTRLKLEVSYAAEWISYYLIKYLSGPLAKIKSGMQDLNNMIVMKMPEWTNKVAKVLSMVVTLFINVGRFVYDAFNAVERFFMSFPKGMRIAIAAIAAITLAMRMNPLLLLLSTAILLIDDFYAYIDGRKSLKSLQPVWAKLIEWSKEFSKLLEDNKGKMSELWSEMLKSPTYKLLIDALKDSFIALKEGIGATKEITVEFFGDLAKSMEKEGVASQFNTTIETMAKLINDVSSAIKDLMVKLHLLSGDTKTKSWLAEITDELARQIKRVAMLSEMFAHLASAAFKISVGDFKGAKIDLGAAGVAGAGAVASLLGVDNPYAKKSSNGGGGATVQQGNDIATQVSNISGLPANLIYGQMAHETGNFSEMAGSHNYGGLKNSDGSYKDFDSDDAFAKYYAWYLHQYDENGISQATTPEAWAHALKQGGYYEDAEENYANGVGNWSQKYQPPVQQQAAAPQDTSASASADYPPNTSYQLASYNGMNALSASYATPSQGSYQIASADNGVNVGAININVAGTNASAADIQQATIEGIKQATGKQVAIETRDLQGILV